MYKRCTTEKAAMQQRRLEECLLAVMREKPLTEITVSSLCEQTDLSRKTFYRLFDGRQDVLHSLIDRVIREYIRFRLPGEALVPGVSEELLAFYTYWQEQRLLLDALSKNGISTLLFERCVRHTMEEEPGMMHQLGAGPEVSHKAESLLFYLSGLLTLVVAWHHKGYDKSPREMAEITEKLLSNPPLR